MSSVTQFIYKDCLQMQPFEPPEPKGKKSKYGDDKNCWLCGGDTESKGWHVKDVVGSAFTDTNQAVSLASSTMCYSCAALMKKEAWQPACEKHGHSPYFPVKDGKKPFLSNWMFSSHVFSKGFWLRPERKDLAEVLLNPPKAPFVISIADMGKKHVLFKSKVSHSSDVYFVNLDERVMQVHAKKFAEILDTVESAYEFFSKDSLLTGNYNQAAIMKVGLKKWQEVEAKLAELRKSSYDMLLLACFVARKADS